MKIETTLHEFYKTIANQRKLTGDSGYTYSPLDNEIEMSFHTANYTKFDITDLVKDQLKVKVPEEIPWDVYEELVGHQTLFNLSWLLTDDETTKKWLLASGNGQELGKRQLIIARGLIHGFKLAERKFRVPLQGLAFGGDKRYVAYNTEVEEFDASTERSMYQLLFTDSQLKDLNAPEWIMQLPREYVEE
ncbi:hypothetical protein [Paucilactobacillus sp. N302-9]